MIRKLYVGVAIAALFASGCSSDKPWVHAVERSDSVPAVDGADGLSAQALIEALASDELAGRDNQSPGSTAAQDLIIDQLAQFAQPALPDGYLQPFAYGSNILALIPGGDLADEYIVIGAHYDHLGTQCESSDVADQICNGATDNASGVATVISIARAIAAEGPPRRSVLVALWDAEEDGLLGSAAYVAAPVVPLAQTVAYLNFDIQGVTLLPSLANVTIAIGAETGGDTLAQATAQAMAASTLQPLLLSSFMFYGRSDHANFASAGIPSMLLTDSTSGCYHTAQDEAGVVDYAKLDQQVGIGTALVRKLAEGDAAPQLDSTAPRITFDDVTSLLEFARQSEPDLGLLSPGAEAQISQFASDLQTIVDAGAVALNEAAIAIVMNGIDQMVEALTRTACQGFTP